MVEFSARKHHENSLELKTLRMKKMMKEDDDDDNDDFDKAEKKVKEEI